MSGVLHIPGTDVSWGFFSDKSTWLCYKDKQYSSFLSHLHLLTSQVCLTFSRSLLNFSHQSRLVSEPSHLHTISNKAQTLLEMVWRWTGSVDLIRHWKPVVLFVWMSLAGRASGISHISWSEVENDLWIRLLDYWWVCWLTDCFCACILLKKHTNQLSA